MHIIHGVNVLPGPEKADGINQFHIGISMMHIIHEVSTFSLTDCRR